MPKPERNHIEDDAPKSVVLRRGVSRKKYKELCPFFRRESDHFSWVENYRGVGPANFNNQGRAKEEWPGGSLSCQVSLPAEYTAYIGREFVVCPTGLSIYRARYGHADLSTFRPKRSLVHTESWEIW